MVYERLDWGAHWRTMNENLIDMVDLRAHCDGEAHGSAGDAGSDGADRAAADELPHEGRD